MKTASGTVPCSYSSSSRTSRNVASPRRSSASAGSTSSMFCLVRASSSRKPGIVSPLGVSWVVPAIGWTGPLGTLSLKRLVPGSGIPKAVRAPEHRPHPPIRASTPRKSCDGRGLDVNQVLGIDIGGTGIKGAPVDVEKGTLTADRYRLLTPKPALPGSVADVVAEVVAKFGGDGPVGATFPAVI